MSATTSNQHAGARDASVVKTIVPAAVLAAIGAVITYFVFNAAGATFDVTTMGQEVTVGAGRSALMAGLLTLVGGTIALLIARRTKKPTKTFTALVVVGVVLMAFSPLGATEDGLTVAALEVMHLVVAAIVLATVLPRLRNNRA